MGKASSSKKVARAARAGGSVTSSSRKLGFPLAIFTIVVLGVGLIVFARSGSDTASAQAPTIDDHWHNAYGIYVCDKFLAPFPQSATDPKGIHTHGDGIIHIHPFTNSSAGNNAKLTVFGESVGMDVGKDSFTIDGTKYANGYDCGGKPATVSVYEWPADDPNAEPTITTTDFNKIRFTADRQAFTIAIVPEGTDVPRPESIPTLDNLSDVGAQSGPSTATSPSTTAGVGVNTQSPEGGTSSTSAAPSATSTTSFVPPTSSTQAP